MLTVIHAREPLPQKLSPFELRIFLAGPSPRSPDVPSWRPDVTRRIETAFAHWEGLILNPEDRNGYRKLSKEEGDAQEEWEDAALESSSRIIMWIPRNDTTMPGFTTNIEFGFWSAKDPRRLMVGAPPDAPHMGHIRRRCKRLGIWYKDSIEGLIDQLERIREPF